MMPILSQEKTKTGGPCVYFVQAATGGPIKIGIAMDLTNRLKGLQHTSPVPLVCLAWMPGYAEEEQALHERFGAGRLHGEWFEPTEDLLALIEGLNCDNHLAPHTDGSVLYSFSEETRRTLKTELKQVRAELQETKYAQHIGVNVDALTAKLKQLRGELKEVRHSLKKATQDLERVRDVRRKTRWRICGLDPAAWVLDPAADLVAEDEAAERLIETENEVRLTLFWDDGERKFAIRVLEGDAEFTDKAWERIVEAAMVYADSLNSSLHAADVVW